MLLPELLGEGSAHDLTAKIRGSRKVGLSALAAGRANIWKVEGMEWSEAMDSSIFFVSAVSRAQSLLLQLYTSGVVVSNVDCGCAQVQPIPAEHIRHLWCAIGDDNNLAEAGGVDCRKRC